MSEAAPAQRPLRVAIVGSGPSGFFVLERLAKRRPDAQIDMYERLPTPFGLVRGGVAPDHPNIKAVARVFDRLARLPDVRFLGNVAVGRDVTHAELGRQYHAVVYATGALADRRLGIPGECLCGVHAASEFVGWYNGHPDYRDCSFDLSQDNAAIVGMGNVALDVARILATDAEALAATDIATHALDALRASRVRDIYVLGRRGPAQAAFTSEELRELGELPDAGLRIASAELALDEPSARAVRGEAEDSPLRANLATLAALARRAPGDRRRTIHLRFLVSPVELLGGRAVHEVRLARNRLTQERGRIEAVPTGQVEALRAGLVFRSVGFRSVPIPGVPFDAATGVIPNLQGRVTACAGDREVLPGVYAAGWIRRGPTGVIGTNKPDAHATADALLDDFAAGRLPAPDPAPRDALPRLLEARGVAVVSYEDWLRLDEIEQERGRERGRPRIKLCDVGEMLRAIGPRRGAAAQNALERM